MATRAAQALWCSVEELRKQRVLKSHPSPSRQPYQVKPDTIATTTIAIVEAIKRAVGSEMMLTDPTSPGVNRFTILERQRLVSLDSSRSFDFGLIAMGAPVDGQSSLCVSQVVKVSATMGACRNFIAAFLKKDYMTP